MKKSIINKWEQLYDCLRVIDHKCPIADLGRSYSACTMCILVGTNYRLTEVLTRPIPEPESMTTKEELKWFEIIVEDATQRLKD